MNKKVFAIIFSLLIIGCTGCSSELRALKDENEALEQKLLDVEAERDSLEEDYVMKQGIRMTLVDIERDERLALVFQDDNLTENTVTGFYYSINILSEDDEVLYSYDDKIKVDIEPLSSAKHRLYIDSDEVNNYAYENAENIKYEYEVYEVYYE